MKAGRNRRQFLRFPFEAEASLMLPKHGRLSCSLMDLSINGALVDLASNEAQLAGMPALLELVLTGRVHEDRVDIQAKVEAVWQEGRLLGCRFIDVDADSFSHLKTLTEDNLGDTCLLDRELTQLTYWPGVESVSKV